MIATRCSFAHADAHKTLASVRAVSGCIGYMLTRADYTDLVHRFPSFRTYLDTIARMRLKKEVGKGAAGDNADLNQLITTRETRASRFTARMSVACGRLSRRLSEKGAPPPARVATHQPAGQLTGAVP